jgi:thiol:disulfide interchange protein DsbD
MALIRSHSRHIPIFITALLWVVFGFREPVPAQEELIKLEVLHAQDHYQAGKTYPLLLRVTITDGWYIHGDKLGDPFLFPTRLLFDKPPQVKIGSIRFPKAKAEKFAYVPEPLELYSGTILVQTDLAIQENAPVGELLVNGKIEYQACTSNSCIPVEELPVKIAISVVGPEQPVQKLNQELFAQAGKPAPSFRFLNFEIGTGVGLPLTLLVFFLFGLGLNLTPCIYPLIPITVAYFGGKNDPHHHPAATHSFFYLIGITVTNSLLGVVASLSGSMLGALLQSSFVLSGMALLFLWLALSFFGFWELRLPNRLMQAAAKNYSGLFGSFFMGLTLGVLAAPCIGPFIIFLITYVAQLGDPLLGFLFFFVLSLGLGLPLALLAVFSGLIQKLPYAGDWMIWVRKFFGWVLIGGAVYFLNIAIQWGIDPEWLYAGLAVIAGVHLGWLEPSGRGLEKFLWFKRIAGSFLILCGIVYSLMIWQAQRGYIAWIPFEQQQLIYAAQKNKPAILDVTAQWCTPCQIMEKRIFRNTHVADLLKETAALRLDLTSEHPQQQQILAQYGIRGVPSILFFNRQGKEEKDLRVEEIVSRAEFMRRMKELMRRSDSLK